MCRLAERLGKRLVSTASKFTPNAPVWLREGVQPNVPVAGLPDVDVKAAPGGRPVADRLRMSPASASVAETASETVWPTPRTGLHSGAMTGGWCVPDTLTAS